MPYQNRILRTSLSIHNQLLRQLKASFTRTSHESARRKTILLNGYGFELRSPSKPLAADGIVM